MTDFDRSTELKITSSPEIQKELERFHLQSKEWLGKVTLSGQSYSDLAAHAKRLINDKSVLSSTITRHMEQWSLDLPPLSESLRSLAQASLTLGKLFSSEEYIRDFHKLSDIASSWASPQLDLKIHPDSLPIPDIQLTSQMAEMMRLSIVAEQEATHISAAALSTSLGLSSDFSKSVMGTLDQMTQSYLQWVVDLKAPANLLSLAPPLTGLSAVEVFAETHALRTLCEPPSAPSITDQVESLSSDTNARLAQLLAAEDPAFLSMWRGSNQALHSSNPDHIRQFAVSRRELFTRVLHKLSPDQEIKSWTSRPEDYSNGRPTRRARINYVCRNIKPGMEKWINSDCTAALELSDLYQEMTHQPKSPFQDVQIHALMLRMDSLLLYLLELSRYV